MIEVSVSDPEKEKLRKAYHSSGRDGISLLLTCAIISSGIGLLQSIPSTWAPNDVLLVELSVQGCKTGVIVREPFLYDLELSCTTSLRGFSPDPSRRSMSDDDDDDSASGHVFA